MNEHHLAIIDAHCHLWELRQAAALWISPEWGYLFRSFTPDDIRLEGSKIGVTQGTAIECGVTAPENEWLAQTVGSSDFISAFAPHIDLESPRLDAELDTWMQYPKVRAVRMRFEGNPDHNILKRPSIQEGLRRVAERGLIFEFLVRDYHLQDILAICNRIPELKGIIEHMAKPGFRDGKNRDAWRQGMEDLARNTTLTCKLSLSPQMEQVAGLLLNPGIGWPSDLIKPYVQHVCEHFGTQRLIWGSDWPIAALTSDYVGTYKAMIDALGPINPDVESLLFVENARRFYRV